MGACVRGQGHSHVRSLSRDHVERSMQTTPPPRPCCCRSSAWRGPGGCRGQGRGRAGRIYARRTDSQVLCFQSMALPLGLWAGWSGWPGWPVSARQALHVVNLGRVAWWSARDSHRSVTGPAVSGSGSGETALRLRLRLRLRCTRGGCIRFRFTFVHATPLKPPLQPCWLLPSMDPSGGRKREIEVRRRAFRSRGRSFTSTSE